MVGSMKREEADMEDEGLTILSDFPITCKEGTGIDFCVGGREGGEFALARGMGVTAGQSRLVFLTS